ncbi:MAG TPA: DUF5985 family protein [Rhizomicrobium sp.]|nr:DUF5985 family protein [Rhizomicrobium sp.]
MSDWPAIVYLLCLATSCVCAALLFRAWDHNRSALLLWTAAAFIFLALNNLALVVDLVLLPQADLWALRLLSSLIASGILIYGFIWESGP